MIELPKCSATEDQQNELQLLFSSPKYWELRTKHWNPVVLLSENGKIQVDTDINSMRQTCGWQAKNGGNGAAKPQPGNTDI